MRGLRSLPSAPASREAGDASASGARQRWASSAVECRKERAAIAPIGFGPRARTSSARAPTPIRRARSSDPPAAAYQRRAPGTTGPLDMGSMSTDRPDGSARQRLRALEARQSRSADPRHSQTATTLAPVGSQTLCCSSSCGQLRRRVGRLHGVRRQRQGGQSRGRRHEPGDVGGQL